MSARTIDNPGVELNEIDRSSYDKVDNSLPNSPTSLIFGFADKGEDMTLEWINSKATLDDTFGTPTTEFESFLYNAAMECLNRGGTCIASKLPYLNRQLNKYNYITFNVSDVKPLVVNGHISIDNPTLVGIRNALQELIAIYPIAEPTMNDTYDLVNVFRQLYLAIKSRENPADINNANRLYNELQRLLDETLITTGDFPLVLFNDTTLTSYVDISVDGEGSYGSMDDMSDLDDLLTSKKQVFPNTIRIYDITRAKYGKLENYDCVYDNSISTYTNECIGIVPVIVGAANAMYFQNILNAELYDGTPVPNDYREYNAVSTFYTIGNESIEQGRLQSTSDYLSLPLASTPVGDASPITIDSLSRRAALQFPPISFRDPFHFDKTNLKKIGVAVFKAFRDTSNSGRLNFQLVESFVGSLDRTARDEMTNASLFIDDIVNLSSQLIRFFSRVEPRRLAQMSFIGVKQQPAVSMGFYGLDCGKNISYVKSIVQPLTTMLDKSSNRNVLPLDMVVDAGVSNIAQLAKSRGTAIPGFSDTDVINTNENPRISDFDDWVVGAASTDIAAWKAILQKFDALCKNTRKDCMFLADGLRPICLQGDQKFIRQTAPQNTVANTIIPKFRLMANVLDSSYSAGYCNWFMQQDYSNGIDYIWIPPSIKAMGAYIYCDTYFHTWNAPAGHTRGIVRDALDVAFIPTDADAGVIYSNSWNYAMSYPIDGIVIEGHKTFQIQRTALDRVNVRRLMLSLEKKVARVAQSFVYEQNTAYVRQQFVDAIRPILEDAKSGDGISDYAIKCDDELNTIEAIENNELRCKIGVKPVKVVDYIVISLICVNQSASVSEEVLR